LREKLKGGLGGVASGFRRFLVFTGVGNCSCAKSAGQG
jgi:hypothetical protein